MYIPAFNIAKTLPVGPCFNERLGAGPPSGQLELTQRRFRSGNC